MADTNFTSRRELSFTATSDAPGIASNWNVPHDKDSYCGDTVPIGRRYFDEVAELAVHNEREAFYAVLTAINSPEWNHTADGSGWGIERGFSQQVVAAALVGLRAMREGADPYDYLAKNETDTKGAA
jgi:hypothetical protein